MGRAISVAFARAGADIVATDLAPGGTRNRSFASSVLRSAVPLPCAIHVPEQARITGSIAVTSPLAGRRTMTLPSAACSWI